MEREKPFCCSNEKLLLTALSSLAVDVTCPVPALGPAGEGSWPGRAAGSRLPSTADPVYCKEQPDLWGIKLDEQEKHKSVQKLLPEPLLYADPSTGLDRRGQRRAAEKVPRKPEGLVPSGAAAGPRTGKEPEPQPSPSTPLLPLAASSSSSKAHPRQGSGAAGFWYQCANPYSKLLAGCFLSMSPSTGEKKWGF